MFLKWVPDVVDRLKFSGLLCEIEELNLFKKEDWYEFCGGCSVWCVYDVCSLEAP